MFEIQMFISFMDSFVWGARGNVVG
jgi:hypothetical protein